MAHLKNSQLGTNDSSCALQNCKFKKHFLCFKFVLAPILKYF